MSSFFAEVNFSIERRKGIEIFQLEHLQVSWSIFITFNPAQSNLHSNTFRLKTVEETIVIGIIWKKYELGTLYVRILSWFFNLDSILSEDY